MDRTTLYNPKLVAMVADLARAKKIPLQFKRGASGGNDAGRIHLSREGVPVVSISVPCRYLHSSLSIISNDDYENCIRLVREIIKEIPPSFVHTPIND